MFKRILGEYAPQFQGYGQHDSHECINTVLDLMGEDLYRKGKKPYVDMDVKEGQEEELASYESWNKHLLRNESIITDLFHGQFKSTVNCSKCDRVSITFDPYMAVSVAIPGPRKNTKFFYIPYDLKDGYVNNTGTFSARASDTMAEMRKGLHKKFELEPSSYIITKV